MKKMVALGRRPNVILKSEILILSRHGYTAKEISARMAIPSSTVCKYLKLLKLNPQRFHQVRAGSSCFLCRAIGQLSDHHIKPRYLGGGDDPKNKIPLCSACHDYIEESCSQCLNQVENICSRVKFFECWRGGHPVQLKRLKINREEQQLAEKCPLPTWAAIPGTLKNRHEMRQIMACALSKMGLSTKQIAGYMACSEKTVLRWLSDKTRYTMSNRHKLSKGLLGRFLIPSEVQTKSEKKIVENQIEAILEYEEK